MEDGAETHDAGEGKERVSDERYREGKRDRVGVLTVLANAGQRERDAQRRGEQHDAGDRRGEDEPDDDNGKQDGRRERSRREEGADDAASDWPLA